MDAIKAEAGNSNPGNGVHQHADHPNLGQWLCQRLESPAPLPRATTRMSLAYGRHRGPAPLGTRRAAVVIALYQNKRGHWTIPLTLRPRTLQHHGGQISLPGGRIEPGEDAYDAALREFHEELGIAPTVMLRCGLLSTQYVYASGNLVQPVVTIISSPGQSWQPDPIEVQEVLEMPLSVLIDDRARVYPTRQIKLRKKGSEVGSLSIEIPAFRFENHHIWGATALILDQLAQILRPTR